MGPAPKIRGFKPRSIEILINDAAWNYFFGERK